MPSRRRKNWNPGILAEGNLQRLQTGNDHARAARDCGVNILVCLHSTDGVWGGGEARIVAGDPSFQQTASQSAIKSMTETPPGEPEEISG